MPSDVDALFGVCSDPRVWSHFPTLRHTDPGHTARMVERWRADWRRDGLATWVVRESGASRVVGYGGCGVRANLLWNLGYRLAPEVQGRGLAVELAVEGLPRARAVRPELPVVAYLLEHNASSRAVAERVGLRLVQRGPDAGNPDPGAVRLVLADRSLSPAELRAARA